MYAKILNPTLVQAWALRYGNVVNTPMKELERFEKNGLIREYFLADRWSFLGFFFTLIFTYF